MVALYAVLLLSIPVIIGAIVIIFCVNYEPKALEELENDNETNLFI